MYSYQFQDAVNVLKGALRLDDLSAIDASTDSHVCLHSWGAGETAVRCATCATTPFSAICLDCFKNGDHAGHEYVLYVSAAGGSCDCGDPRSWNRHGCCSKHRPGAAPQAALLAAPCDITFELNVFFLVSSILENLLLLTNVSSHGMRVPYQGRQFDVVPHTGPSPGPSAGPNKLRLRVTHPQAGADLLLGFQEGGVSGSGADAVPSPEELRQETMAALTALISVSKVAEVRNVVVKLMQAPLQDVSSAIQASAKARPGEPSDGLHAVTHDLARHLAAVGDTAFAAANAALDSFLNMRPCTSPSVYEGTVQCLSGRASYTLRPSLLRLTLKLAPSLDKALLEQIIQVLLLLLRDEGFRQAFGNEMLDFVAIYHVLSTHPTNSVDAAPPILSFVDRINVQLYQTTADSWQPEASAPLQLLTAHCVASRQPAARHPLVPASCTIAEYAVLCLDLQLLRYVLDRCIDPDIGRICTMPWYPEIQIASRIMSNLRLVMSLPGIAQYVLFGQEAEGWPALRTLFDCLRLASASLWFKRKTESPPDDDLNSRDAFVCAYALEHEVDILLLGPLMTAVLGNPTRSIGVPVPSTGPLPNDENDALSRRLHLLMFAYVCHASLPDRPTDHSRPRREQPLFDRRRRIGTAVCADTLAAGVFAGEVPVGVLTPLERGFCLLLLRRMRLCQDLALRRAPRGLEQQGRSSGIALLPDGCPSLEAALAELAPWAPWAPAAVEAATHDETALTHIIAAPLSLLPCFAQIQANTWTYNNSLPQYAYVVFDYWQYARVSDTLAFVLWLTEQPPSQALRRWLCLFADLKWIFGPQFCGLPSGSSATTDAAVRNGDSSALGPLSAPVRHLHRSKLCTDSRGVGLSPDNASEKAQAAMRQGLASGVSRLLALFRSILVADATPEELIRHVAIHCLASRARSHSQVEDVCSFWWQGCPPGGTSAILERVLQQIAVRREEDMQRSAIYTLRPELWAQLDPHCDLLKQAERFKALSQAEDRLGGSARVAEMGCEPPRKLLRPLAGALNLLLAPETLRIVNVLLACVCRAPSSSHLYALPTLQLLSMCVQHWMAPASDERPSSHLQAPRDTPRFMTQLHDHERSVMLRLLTQDTVVPSAGSAGEHASRSPSPARQSASSDPRTSACDICTMTSLRKLGTESDSESAPDAAPDVRACAQLVLTQMTHLEEQCGISLSSGEQDADLASDQGAEACEGSSAALLPRSSPRAGESRSVPGALPERDERDLPRAATADRSAAKRQALMSQMAMQQNAFLAACGGSGDDSDDDNGSAMDEDTGLLHNATATVPVDVWACNGGRLLSHDERASPHRFSMEHFASEAGEGEPCSLCRNGNAKGATNEYNLHEWMSEMADVEHALPPFDLRDGDPVLACSYVHPVTAISRDAAGSAASMHAIDSEALPMVHCCGHRLHVSCHLTLLRQASQSLLTKDRIEPLHFEYLCPVCRRLCNCLLPLAEVPSESAPADVAAANAAVARSAAPAVGMDDIQHVIRGLAGLCQRVEGQRRTPRACARSVQFKEALLYHGHIERYIAALSVTAGLDLSLDEQSAFEWHQARNAASARSTAPSAPRLGGVITHVLLSLASLWEITHLRPGGLDSQKDSQKDSWLSRSQRLGLQAAATQIVRGCEIWLKLWLEGKKQTMEGGVVIPDCLSSVLLAMSQLYGDPATDTGDSASDGWLRQRLKDACYWESVPALHFVASREARARTEPAPLTNAGSPSGTPRFPSVHEDKLPGFMSQTLWEAARARHEAQQKAPLEALDPLQLVEHLLPPVLAGVMLGNSGKPAAGAPPPALRPCSHEKLQAAVQLVAGLVWPAACFQAAVRSILSLPATRRSVAEHSATFSATTVWHALRACFSPPSTAAAPAADSASRALVAAAALAVRPLLLRLHTLLCALGQDPEALPDLCDPQLDDAALDLRAMGDLRLAKLEGVLHGILAPTEPASWVQQTIAVLLTEYLSATRLSDQFVVDLLMHPTFEPHNAPNARQLAAGPAGPAVSGALSCIVSNLQGDLGAVRDELRAVVTRRAALRRPPQHFSDLLLFDLPKATCVRCGNKLTHALSCLRTGRFVCAPGVLCRGSLWPAHTVSQCAPMAYTHECLGDAGVFVECWSAEMLLVVGPRIVKVPSIYLDQYGDEDPSLMRGRPLSLSETRFRHVERLLCSGAVLRAPLLLQNSLPVPLELATLLGVGGMG